MFLYLRRRYQLIPSDDIQVEDTGIRFKTHVKGILSILLVLIISAGIIATLQGTSEKATDETQCLMASCGKTPTSARRSGCIFDMSLFSWVARDCLPTTITTDSGPMASMRTSSWRWANLPFPRLSRDFLPLKVVAEGTQGGLFVNQEFLRSHCLAVDSMWAILEGEPSKRSCSAALSKARLFCGLSGNITASVWSSTGTAWTLLPVRYMSC
ncbi:hypothetical protein F5Y01DRAFT_287470 [Xylaria sp. FL0043]|nr:hypothetical protein F5Y01DRAFT_287470 [Xylaria sp. FL0043]